MSLVEKMANDIERWHPEGSRSATIERTEQKIEEVLRKFESLQECH
jgi:hypothetical protein